MHSLLLHPTDVLFFRDGRPMGGASAGHGAAWPLPHTLNAAFHGVLHRANLENVHGHNHHARNGDSREDRSRKFGGLLTAGPFPVCTRGEAHTWFFPRPLDAAVLEEKITTQLLPIAENTRHGSTSLPRPLRYAAGSTVAPSKDSQPPHWSEGAWNAYLQTTPRNPLAGRQFFKRDGDFGDSEHTYGIGINPETGTTQDKAFYSASYLRLREGWRLGAFAEARDKEFTPKEHGGDLLQTALERTAHTLVLGGQQRTAVCEFCEMPQSRLPLPAGKRTDFTEHDGKFLVKWVLLTPAIWPAHGEHSGGWLPSWVRQTDGKVMLRKGNAERGLREARETWRARVQTLPFLNAHLVAAVVGKSVPVTGFALAHEDAERSEGGAKSTHLAAPAGSVYYFEATSKKDAEDLADALNWHGDDLSFACIRRRRSTLMGEKGFGLGVCGTWDFHPCSP